VENDYLIVWWVSHDCDPFYTGWSIREEFQRRGAALPRLAFRFGGISGLTIMLRESGSDDSRGL
jgi:hypothetical protein